MRIAGIETPRQRSADQFQSIHCGHVVVNDKAPNRRQARLVEQVVAIGKGAHREALTLHQASEGLPHGLIIIDDEDDLLRNLRRRLSYHHLLSLLDGNRTTCPLNHESAAADLIYDKTGLCEPL